MVAPDTAKEFQKLHSSTTTVASSSIRLEDLVQHFSETAPSKRRLELLGIKEGTDIKRRKMKKPKERERSSGEEMPHNIELEIFN